MKRTTTKSQPHYALITGGAGYIGLHLAAWLSRDDKPYILLDRTIKTQTISPHQIHIGGDVGNAETLHNVFSVYAIDTVYHLAAETDGTLANDPDRIYANNVSATFTLLKAMRDHGVRKFIFPSTLGVFGEPAYVPIDEEHIFAPLDALSLSKKIIEEALPDYEGAYGMRYAVLRMPLIAGVTMLDGVTPPPHGLIGEIMAVASGALSHMPIRGDDYETPDGTAVRDILHVHDAVHALVRAGEIISNEHVSLALNLGSGEGSSLKEILEVAERVTGVNLPVSIEPRRGGEPGIVIADAARAFETLQWYPERSTLEMILRDAWEWERASRNPVLAK